MRFTVTCIGSDLLGLRETLERFVNEQWLPAHLTREEAAEIMLDQFKRTIAQTYAVPFALLNVPSRSWHVSLVPGGPYL